MRALLLLLLLLLLQEYVLKVALVVAYQLLATLALRYVHASGDDGAAAVPGSSTVQLLYTWGFVALELYCSLVHGLTLGRDGRLPFVPLMATSVYCALGVVWVWLDMAVEYCKGTAAPQDQLGSRQRPAPSGSKAPAAVGKKQA